MPRLPDLTQQERPIPRALGGVVQLESRTGMEMIPSQQLMGAGQDISKAGIYLEKANDYQAKLEAEDAYNAYQERLTKLAYDPQHGWANKKGRDAYGKEFNDKYTAEFTSAKSEIAAKLKSDEARKYFSQRAAIGELRSREGMWKHAAQQQVAHENEVAAKTVENEMANIWRGFGDNAAFQGSLLRMERITKDIGERRGASPEAIEDMTRDIQNKAWKNRFDAAISAEDTLKAKEIRDAATGVLDTETKNYMDGKLKISIRASKTLSGADEAWDKFAPTDPNSAVQLASMDAFVRQKYGNDPDLVKSIRQELVSRASLWNSQQAEVNAEIKTAVLKAFNEGTSLTQLQKTPQWEAMREEDKRQLTDYVTDRGYTLQERARHEKQYTEGELAKSARPIFWRYADPDMLKAMTQEQIYALQPFVGQQNTEELLRRKDVIEKKPERLFAAKMDRNLIEDWVAKNTTINPKAKNLSTEAKERITGLSAWADQELGRQQQAAGRQFTPEEKMGVLDSALLKQVSIDEWGRDPSFPAPMIRQAERANVYVAPELIPDTYQTEAVNYMRSIGKGRELSDAVLKERMKEKISRAYAARLAGASREEIKKILTD